MEIRKIIDLYDIQSDLKNLSNPHECVNSSPKRLPKTLKKINLKR